MKKDFDHVYQFKITLKGIQPPVGRRIQVPENHTFWDMHATIQDAMGWYDEHLHAFHIVNPRTGLEEEIGIPEEDPVWECRKVLSGWEQPVARYFTSQNTKALYIYDFGDDWQHDIILEKILPREQGGAYPRCLAGKRGPVPLRIAAGYGATWIFWKSFLTKRTTRMKR